MNENNLKMSDGKLGDSLKHGSLFSGIGGFDLASEWMEWENIFHCEWNEFGQRILKYYWPKAISYDDITKTDFSIHRGKIDVLTGGFPCQPYSVAGKRKGKEDERHLWPEMLRAIREIRPRWIVGENVSGIITWNGGLVFEEVQTDLEAEGYEVWADVLPAASVNAPHKRDRVWFVAHSSSERCNNGSDYWQERQICNDQNGDAEEDKPKRNGRKCRISKVGEIGNVTNTESESGRGKYEQRQRKGEFRRCDCENDVTNTKRNGRGEILHKLQCEQSNGQSSHTFNEPDNWEKFPTQTPICDGDDGLSARLDTITFPKWRTESVKGGGNAIVPQVALQIFKAIQEYEKKEGEIFKLLDVNEKAN